MFCDCIFVTVRHGDSYSRETVYVTYGVREDLKREILASPSILPNQQLDGVSCLKN